MNEQMLELRKRYVEIDTRLEYKLATLDQRRHDAIQQARIEKDLAWTRLKQQQLVDDLAA